MVWNYLLFTTGKSAKVVENVNQNRSGEWSSHIHGVLSLTAAGGLKAPPLPRTLGFLSLCSSSSSSTFHPPEQQSCFHRLKEEKITINHRLLAVAD